MARQPMYGKDETVEVYDVSKRRWYKAKTTFCVVWDKETGKEGWMCRLRNGNIGNFDTDHMRRPTK